MRDAANLIHEKFKYPHVSLFTVHLNRRIIAYEAGSGKRSKKLEGYTISLDTPRGLMVWAARLGKTILVNDVTLDDRYVPSRLPPKNTRSELCVPLVFDDKVVGLLDIQSDKINAFTEDDQLMFEAVADTMAAAIRNADLYRSERWRRQVSDSLRDVAGRIYGNEGGGGELVGGEDARRGSLSRVFGEGPADLGISASVDAKLTLFVGSIGLPLSLIRISEPTRPY